MRSCGRSEPAAVEVATAALASVAKTPRFGMTVMFMSSAERRLVSTALAGWASSELKKAFA